MTNQKSMISSYSELIELVKAGAIFEFCIAIALNKGYKDVIKNKKEVSFSVGDYDVLFSKEEMCFTLTHKIYFARVIMAYYHECVFIGYSEEEVINDILVELKKETKNNYE